jgi:hypothetical protein
MLFKKKQSLPVYVEPTSHLIIKETLRDTSDRYLTQLGTKLLEDHPLILDFNQLPIDKANIAIAFFSGISFALQGKITEIADAILLFTYGGAYDDGSLAQYLGGGE